MTDFLEICDNCRLELYDTVKKKCWGCVDMLPQLDRQFEENYLMCRPCLTDPHDICQAEECDCLCKE